VLAEGRRVIGNVERVANLFVSKNVMSLVAIITAALFTLPFPFLPRHLTLVSAVTIGIPAFFLALGPNKRRYIPGFLPRVLRFAVPSGVVAGVVVLVSYLLARNAVGAPPASECLVKTETNNSVANVICWQPSSAATVALLVTAFWILVVLSRPFRLWKAVLVGSMVAIAALAFITPLGQSFFNFSLTPTILWEALLVGAVGALGIEIIYRTEPGMRAAAAD
jgi:cation-transporting ATPase E